MRNVFGTEMCFSEWRKNKSEKRCVGETKFGIFCARNCQTCRLAVYVVKYCYSVMLKVASTGAVFVPCLRFAVFFFQKISKFLPVPIFSNNTAQQKERGEENVRCSCTCIGVDFFLEKFFRKNKQKYQSKNLPTLSLM
jgi:hypothetical protein